MSQATTRDASSRAIEVFAVILLAAATVGSAWCAYQSTRWNGEESTFARQSTDQRIEATRLFSLGTQTITYDSSLAIAYAEAFVNGDEELKDFYRNVLVRPEFAEVLDGWEDSAEAGTGDLGGLLTNEDYLASRLAGYTEASEASDELSVKALDAGETADNYIVLTLVLAGSLFFAGITGSFHSRTIQLVLLSIAAILIAITVGQLSGLPIA